MKYLIRTPPDCEIVNEQFNGFHDACLNRLEVLWAHVLDDAGTLQLSDELIIAMTFSHSNYRGAKKPFQNNVDLALRGVSDVRADFSAFKPSDWTIDQLTAGIVDERQNWAFSLTGMWCFYQSGAWQTREALRVLFREAEIRVPEE